MKEHGKNHHRFLRVFKDSGGREYSTSEIAELMLRKTDIKRGSILPNDHAIGNKGGCTCANTDARIFDRIGRGLFRVREGILHMDTTVESSGPAFGSGTPWHAAPRSTENHFKRMNPEKARLENIIDMALDFTAMIRVFKKQSKQKLHRKMLDELPKVFNAKSRRHYEDIHRSFCEWGIKNISLAKKDGNASYGEIAKTFDVVLKVAVYYCHFPNHKKSQQISRWLNAAVDNQMRAMLWKTYPDEGVGYVTLAQVDSNMAYTHVQGVVRRFIREKHEDCILFVQFDDIYWRLLNR